MKKDNRKGRVVRDVNNDGRARFSTPLLEKNMSRMNRRQFIGAAAGAAALTQIPSGVSAAERGQGSISIQALDAAAAKPVLRLD